MDFSSTGVLEFFNLDFSNYTLEPQALLAKVELQDKVNSISWGESGLLALGTAEGNVDIWDPSSISQSRNKTNNISASKLSPITTLKRHTGAVLSLDFNPLKPHLLASAGTDSEITIWDISKPTSPIPVNVAGTKSVSESITTVAWNKKVEYIMASTSQNGTSVVWNVKDNRAILTFSDPKRKHRCRVLAWNPTEPTQLITASEEDAYPVIEVWDLKNTYAPSRYLEGHTKGIWAVSWCPYDSSLLLSTGKDNRTLCWNMNTGAMIEVDETSTWNFDVQWSPQVTFFICYL